MNVVVHEYVGLDLARAVEAMHELGPIEEFLAIVRAIENDAASRG